MSDIEFSLEKQKVLIEYALSNPSIYRRCQSMIKAKYFDSELRDLITFLQNFAEKYNAVPTAEQIKVDTGIIINTSRELRGQDYEWALDEIERFCQNAAIVRAVIKSTDFIEIGNYGKVLEKIQTALMVGLKKDLGTDYFKNPKERLEKMKATDLIPTGFHEIDRKLFGGLNRGEITIIAASSGMGKSLFLQNICLNMVEGASYKWGEQIKQYRPLEVLYITLELSEALSSKRIDTMITGIDARDIFKKIDEVELKVRIKGKKSGHLQIKFIEPGSTTNDIRAYLEEYEIERNTKPDVIAVDYLDELNSNGREVGYDNIFAKDNLVTLQLRNLAIEYDVPLITASQLNRSATDESEHNHSMIAGGISKIQKSDNVISIYMSPAMKERGEYMVQFLKTRSSSGVGSKIFLGFDDTSLRIYNLEEGYESNDELQNDDIRNKVRAMPANDQILKSIKKGPIKSVKYTTTTKNVLEEVEMPAKSTVSSNKDPVNTVLSPTERLKALQDKKLL